MLERPSGAGSHGVPYQERVDVSPTGLDLLCTTLWGRVAPFFEGHHSGALWSAVLAVEWQAPRCSSLSEAALSARLEGIRAEFAARGLVRGLVIETFALLREVSHRRLGLRHHPVQLMGAFALIDGKLAEMATGEGKTIVAGLAAATAALAGLPTHVITVNDYLASRDAALLRPLYDFARVSVATIQHAQSPAERRQAYGAEITYVANKEVVFDYLRDRFALAGRRPSFFARSGAGHSPVEKGDLLLRGLHFAIVDEADSVLIDEARTPLILSAAEGSQGDPDRCRSALEVADRLVEHVHFTLLTRHKSVRLTRAGADIAARLLEPRGGVWRARTAREEAVCQALSARHLYHRDRDYVVVDDKVQIVDEHTGRIAEGRSWQHGLHQMIETIEGVAASDRRLTSARITYQSFFRRYLRLAGMSGTLAEIVAEARNVYGLATVRIEPHRPARRRDVGTRLFRSDGEKVDAIIGSVQCYAKAGRPVLIGTRSIAASERLSRHLTDAGISHVVLNACHDKDEAEIVSKAGRIGSITVATNLAGRGTDIRLDAAAVAAGGLHVVLTELHESRRIDRQFIGRGGRQGDPSTYETFLSLDDDLFRAFAPRLTGGLRHFPCVSSIAMRLSAATLRWRAQKAAEKYHRRIRQRLFRARNDLDRMLAFAPKV